MGSGSIRPELAEFCISSGVPLLPYNETALKDGSYIDEYDRFYSRVAAAEE